MEFFLKSINVTDKTFFYIPQLHCGLLDLISQIVSFLSVQFLVVIVPFEVTTMHPALSIPVRLPPESITKKTTTFKRYLLNKMITNDVSS
jgi:hypothetical protein